jgi:hypothetical protein
VPNLDSVTGFLRPFFRCPQTNCVSLGCSYLRCGLSLRNLGEIVPTWRLSFLKSNTRSRHTSRNKDKGHQAPEFFILAPCGYMATGILRSLQKCVLMDVAEARNHIMDEMEGPVLLALRSGRSL